MEGIAKQLSPESFNNFFKKFKLFHPNNDVKTQKNENEITIENLREQFLVDYGNLETDSIVLFFDTVEMESDAAKRFCGNLLIKMRVIKKCTLVVKAGRKSFPIENDLKSLSPNIIKK